MKAALPLLYTDDVSLELLQTLEKTTRYRAAACRFQQASQLPSSGG